MNLTARSKMGFMKRHGGLFLLTLLIFRLSYGQDYEHIECKEMEKVIAHPEEGSLFVFDLDNTLIESVQQLGTYQWFCYLCDELIKDGLTAEQANQKAIEMWTKVHSVTEVKPVEKKIPKLLRKIQEVGVVMIGLTSRPPTIVDRTLYHLASVGINFIHAPILETETPLIKYAGGVIFVAKKVDKGTALNAFLETSNLHPKKVIFVDDKLKHVQDVINAMKLRKTPCLGVRYGGADHHVQSFNHKIADLQWKYFQNILPDEAALGLIGNR